MNLRPFLTELDHGVQKGGHFAVVAARVLLVEVVLDVVEEAYVAGLRLLKFLSQGNDLDQQLRGWDEGPRLAIGLTDARGGVGSWEALHVGLNVWESHLLILGLFLNFVIYKEGV